MSLTALPLPSMPRAAAALLALACGWAGMAEAQVPTPRPGRKAVGCLIAPDRVADIGAPSVGVVQRMRVELGDPVQAGQTLVLLSADVEGANLQVARARSVVDAEVQAAEAERSLASQRLERSIALEQQGFVSPQATEQLRAEFRVAEQRLQLARGQLRVSASELELARAQLGQRLVKAPFDGVVIDRYVNDGERVEEKPLLRLAKLDLLRVELVVPAQHYGRFAPGQALPVTPELPGAGPVEARISHVDPVIDPASNTFRVRLALPNADRRLPGGARCSVTLDEQRADAAPKGAASASGRPASMPASARAGATATATATATTTTATTTTATPALPDAPDTPAAGPRLAPASIGLPAPRPAPKAAS